MIKKISILILLVNCSLMGMHTRRVGPPRPTHRTLRRTVPHRTNANLVNPNPVNASPTQWPGTGHVITSPRESLINLARERRFSEIQPLIEQYEIYFMNHPDWLDVQSEDGQNTVLHFVIVAGDLKVFSYLIQRGAKTDIENNAHQTVRQLAERKETDEFIALIRAPQPSFWENVRNNTHAMRTDRVRNGFNEDFTLEQFTKTTNVQRKNFDAAHTKELLLIQAILDYVNGKKNDMGEISKWLNEGALVDTRLPIGIPIRSRLNILAANSGRFADAFGRVKNNLKGHRMALVLPSPALPQAPPAISPQLFQSSAEDKLLDGSLALYTLLVVGKWYYDRLNIKF